jgi:hypothetical protein
VRDESKLGSMFVFVAVLVDCRMMWTGYEGEKMGHAGGETWSACGAGDAAGPS